MSILKTPLMLPLQKIVETAPTGAGVTVVDEGNVSLTMPLIPDVARRGLALGADGWGHGIIRNVHTAADSEQTNVFPYSAGDGAIPPFPEALARHLDLWLLGVCGARISGAGDLTGGVFEFFPDNGQQFFGVDDSGATITANLGIPLAIFDGQESGTTGTSDEPLLLQGTGGAYLPLRLRLPRACMLRWTTEASATATFDLKLIMGVFQGGLGQDVAS